MPNARPATIPDIKSSQNSVIPYGCHSSYFIKRNPRAIKAESKLPIINIKIDITIVIENKTTALLFLIFIHTQFILHSFDNHLEVYSSDINTLPKYEPKSQVNLL